MGDFIAAGAEYGCKAIERFGLVEACPRSCTGGSVTSFMQVGYRFWGACCAMAVVTFWLFRVLTRDRLEGLYTLAIASTTI